MITKFNQIILSDGRSFIKFINLYDGFQDGLSRSKFGPFLHVLKNKFCSFNYDIRCLNDVKKYQNGKRESK